jgi:quercetin dioxygenase-like cupin family protein
MPADDTAGSTTMCKTVSNATRTDRWLAFETVRMSDDFAIVDPAEIADEPFNESAVTHRKLTEPLGATEMRVNSVTLEPGDVLAPHAHERQEEIYVAVTGGQVRIEGDVCDVPEGGVVRVGPDPLRGLCNETDDETHTWVLFGAPPVGPLEDCGEYVMPEEIESE